MILIILCCVCCLLAPAVDGKTEEEWTAAVNQLFSDNVKYYRADDVDGFKSLLTEDMHRLEPNGPVKIGLDFDKLEMEYEDDLEIKLTSIRWFCENAVVFEYTVCFGHAAGLHKGQGLALAVEENGKLRYMSYSFNTYT